MVEDDLAESASTSGAGPARELNSSSKLLAVTRQAPQSTESRTLRSGVATSGKMPMNGRTSSRKRTTGRGSARFHHRFRRLTSHDYVTCRWVNEWMGLLCSLIDCTDLYSLSLSLTRGDAAAAPDGVLALAGVIRKNSFLGIRGVYLHCPLSFSGDLE